MNKIAETVYLYSPWNGTVKEYIGDRSVPDGTVIRIRNKNGSLIKTFASCSTSEGVVTHGVVWYRQPNLKEATIAIVGFLNAFSEKQRESLTKHAKALGELPPGPEYDKIKCIAEKELTLIRNREELVKQLIYTKS